MSPQRSSLDDDKNLSIIDNEKDLALVVQHGAGNDIGVEEVVPRVEQTHRELKARQMTMIALGGSIGTGLVIGSGPALAKCGPGSLLVSYIMVGTVCYSLLVALGEMSTLFPSRKGFAGHATRFVDPAFGFTVALAYMCKYLIVSAFQIVAGALVIKFWNSEINSAVFITIEIAAVIAINILGIKWFGEIEFWLSTIKLITLVGLIILGLIIDLGGVPGQERIAFRYWKDGKIQNVATWSSRSTRKPCTGSNSATSATLEPESKELHMMYNCVNFAFLRSFLHTKKPIPAHLSFRPPANAWADLTFQSGLAIEWCSREGSLVMDIWFIAHYALTWCFLIQLHDYTHTGNDSSLFHMNQAVQCFQDWAAVNIGDPGWRQSLRFKIAGFTSFLRDAAEQQRMANSMPDTATVNEEYPYADVPSLMPDSVFDGFNFDLLTQNGGELFDWAVLGQEE